MNAYQSMYHELTNSITDAMRLLQQAKECTRDATELLIQAQAIAENTYIDSDEIPAE